MSKVYSPTQGSLVEYVPPPRAKTDAPGFQRAVIVARAIARGSFSDDVSQTTVVSDGNALDEMIAKQYHIAWSSADPKAAVAALDRQYASYFQNNTDDQAERPQSPPGPVQTTGRLPVVLNQGAGTPPVPPGSPPAPAGGSQDADGLPLLGGGQAEREAFLKYIAPYFGETPEKTFTDIYFSGYHSSNIKFRFIEEEISEKKPPCLNFRGELKNQQTGQIIGNISCSIWPAEGRAVLDELKLIEQGRGFAKTLIAGQIDAYQRMGLPGVDLAAWGHYENDSDGIGSYAWAKYGWLPSADQWIDLANDIRKRMDEMSEGNGSPTFGRISDTDKSAIEAILARGDPTDIWAISDLQTPTGLNDSRGQPVTLGKALLRQQSWEGSLNFGNQEQMERFYDYVGRRN